MTANTLPDELLRELQVITNEVMQEEAAKDDHFKTIYESQEASQQNTKTGRA